LDERGRSGRVPRIGILSPVTEHGMRDWWKELVRGLHELGYVGGRNIEFIWRFGGGKFERRPALASELADGVDVIMPATPAAIYAAKSASSTIPIVFPLGSDPVGEQTWIYCAPCLGVPPIRIEAPAWFFGIQFLVGIACALTLLAVS
jgi:putative tryptophan/tyrosine transport system substrate-binding protein